MSLRIEILPPGKGSQRVAVEGRLDTHTYEDLDEALAPLLTRQLHSLVLDLSGLDYISSAGLRAISSWVAALATSSARSAWRPRL